MYFFDVSHRCTVYVFCHYINWATSNILTKQFKVIKLLNHIN
jgi:hypothetical protein